MSNSENQLEQYYNQYFFGLCETPFSQLEESVKAGLRQSVGFQYWQMEKSLEGCWKAFLGPHYQN